ncbi:glycosyltransferase family 4 protein [Yimella sp. cx-573]|nr:glycosyltransferase family 4 protein [Yimella sp. cx-573]
MPGTHVTALAREEPVGEIEWVPTQYRRPIKRFIEAGAFAWAKGLDQQSPDDYDWVTSLELCSLVTGQASDFRKRASGRVKQAVITWENMPYQPLYKVPPYRQALESCRDADLLLCMVDAARDHLLLNGFDEERMRVVKPGVDTDIFRPRRGGETPPRVVFTSPLAPNKGIDRVLDAMKIVRRSIPEATLVVAGNGELRPLVEQAAADPRTGVSLAGHLDAHGVAQLLADSAVFCTAPRPTWKWSEQLGLAYLEAQACGLPVVTTRCGTNDEAVKAPNLLVDDDVEALADALITFLSDASLRASVGATNRARMLAEHDLQTQCMRMGEAFAEFEK